VTKRLTRQQKQQLAEGSRDIQARIAEARTRRAEEELDDGRIRSGPLWEMAVTIAKRKGRYYG
jgi:hypothetical protein